MTAENAGRVRVASRIRSGFNEAAADDRGKRHDTRAPAAD